MTDKSWITQFIEEELAARVLAANDPILDKTFSGLSLEEAASLLRDSIQTVRYVCRFMDCFVCPDLRDAIRQKELPNEFIENNKDELNALRLFGHDLSGLSSIIGLNKYVDWEIVMDDAWNIHKVFNTMLTMAYLASQDSKYLREEDIKAWLSHRKESEDRTNNTSLQQYSRTLENRRKHGHVTPEASYHKPSLFSFNYAVHEQEFIFNSSLYAVLENMIKNANCARCSLEGIDDHIDITVSREPVYAVTDDGKGISTDVLPDIFGTYSSTGGGLGLRVAKRIVEMHGGYIQVVSTEEGKKTFCYDTKTQSLSRVAQRPRRTEFSIYLPGNMRTQ